MKRTEQVRVRLVPLDHGPTNSVRVTVEEKKALVRAAHSKGIGLSALLRGLGQAAGARFHEAAAASVEPGLQVYYVIEWAAQEAQMPIGEWLRVIALNTIGCSAIAEHLRLAQEAYDAGLNDGTDDVDE